MGVTRRAKIVCTLGPATSTPERIRGLLEAGMDVARLNFSHGSHADHEQVFHLVRQTAQATGKAVAILADLQGPKIRLGKFADGPHEWRTGDSVVITGDDIVGTRDRVSCTYSKLPQEVRPGDRLLIDDGRVALEVSSIEGNDIRVLVTEGGAVSNNKGISLPNVAVSVPAMSEKDADDLRFALGLGVDMVAMSFVRSADDIKLAHTIMQEVGVHRPVMAKVEKPEAVDHLEAIVAAFDGGVMVARGDLGVELPLDQVPLVQKRAVQLCRENARPVIVATQMLDSMIENSRPTRAEASDVANAVLDGADAVMLSGETSVGKYPVLTVSTMAKIVTTTESGSIGVPRLQHDPRTHGGALTVAASQIARAIGAKALVAFSQTGDTVRRLSRLHCDLPLLAFTPVPEVRDQLALAWGVETFLMPFVQHTDDMFRQVDQALLGLGRADPGDYVVIVAGSPPGTPGFTNTLRVHQLGSLVDAAAARALQ
jgi:pyruvate kinase